MKKFLFFLIIFWLNCYSRGYKADERSCKDFRKNLLIATQLSIESTPNLDENKRNEWILFQYWLAFSYNRCGKPDE